MKLTKYVHSCVLVEDNSKSILFDPGEFSLASGLFDKVPIRKLDYLAITHDHFDHFSLNLVKKLVQAFPLVTIFTTPDLKKILAGEGIVKVSTESQEGVVISPLHHASMEPLMAYDKMSQNIAVHFNKLVSHPGDSVELDRSEKVLLMPLAGPWQAAVEGVAMADRLKPQIAVPIHDWMWNDSWRSTMYEMLDGHFKNTAIQFLPLEYGVAVEV